MGGTVKLLVLRSSESGEGCLAVARTDDLSMQKAMTE